MHYYIYLYNMFIEWVCIKTLRVKLNTNWHTIVQIYNDYGRGRASSGSERDKSFRVNKTPFGAVECVKKNLTTPLIIIICPR